MVRQCLGGLGTARTANRLSAKPCRHRSRSRLPSRVGALGGPPGVVPKDEDNASKPRPISRGTESSNPPSSSGEFVANLIPLLGTYRSAKPAIIVARRADRLFVATARY